MARYSPKLARLLLIRGIARALAPIFVLWGIYTWWLVGPAFALVFTALAGNYVLTYILSWVAPWALNGPWRIRPWQTFVLLLNAILLPIVFYRVHGQVIWGFILVSALFLIGLYAATAILFYLHDRLPMSSIFMVRRGGVIPSAPREPRSPRPPHPTGSAPALGDSGGTQM